MIPVEISSNLNATGGPENQRKLFRCKKSVSYGFQVKSYASTLIVQRLNGTLRGMFEIWKMESKSGSSGLVWSKSTAVKEWTIAFWSSLHSTQTPNSSIYRNSSMSWFLQKKREGAKMCFKCCSLSRVANTVLVGGGRKLREAADLNLVVLVKLTYFLLGILEFYHTIEDKLIFQVVPGPWDPLCFGPWSQSKFSHWSWSQV